MNCVSCSKNLDNHTDPAGDRKPAPGDFSVCAYCGHLYRLDDNLVSIPCTKEMEAALWFKERQAMITVTTIRKRIMIRNRQN